MDIDQANAALLESWELDLRSPVRPGSKPKRERTITHYLTEARRFARWLAEHDRPAGQPGDLEPVERSDVTAWIADLRAAGLSAYTVRNRWIVLRSLYGWAAEEEIIAPNPTAKVSIAKVEEPAPKVLSDEAATALLTACKGTGFIDRRDYALIRLMLATGLRASEVCGLMVADLDLRTRIASITDGKGGRSRVVRFDPTTASAIDRYRRARGRHRYASLPNLWIGHRGPTTRKGLGPLLDKRAALAGIGHVNPHLLRHTFAHRMKSAGASDEALGQLGGWSSPQVMKRYGASMAVERALEAYDRLDPMDGL